MSSGIESVLEKTSRVKPIEWKPAQKANSSVRYAHIIGDTPLGRILITWKNWKEGDSPTVDEAPWYLIDGHAFIVGNSIKDAKEKCEKAWVEYVESALITDIQSEEAAKVLAKNLHESGASSLLLATEFGPVSYAVEVTRAEDFDPRV